ncbi:ABC-2 family transporter protein [Deinococcus sp. SM5_A1]|uniref:ABC-2 family transporter protein n=1 Tax=Deinococcus sp. SM5_A1 TaxID=3379094 RepID=UPI003858D352
MMLGVHVWLTAAQASTTAHLKHHAIFLQNSLIRLINVPAQVAALYFLWLTLGTNTLGGFSPQALLIYNLLTFLVRWLFNFRQVAEDTERAIHEGLLVNNLVRPLPFSAFQFGKVLSKLAVNILALLLVLIPTLIVIGQVPSASSLSGFVALLLIGAVVQYQLYAIIGLLSFWMGRIFGVVYAFDLTLLLSAGTLLPLTVFPSQVASVLLALPFRFFAYSPVQALIGNNSGLWLARELLGAAGWALALAALHALLWQRGVKQYAGAGV